MPTTYDQDFFGWTQDQAAALRMVALENPDAVSDLDWENLAEDIESLGRGELRAMESALVRVIGHLLKLRYSPARNPRAGLQESVDLHRNDLQRLKRDNPGLVRRIDLDGIYASARRIAGKSIEKQDGMPSSLLPTACPFTLEQIEADDWYPEPLDS